MKHVFLFALLLGVGACSSEGAESDAGSSTGGTVSGAGGDASGGTESGGSSSGGSTGSGAAGTGATGSGGDVTASGGTGGALAETPGGMAGAPPETWDEHWFEHNQKIELVEYNDWAVIYADSEVDRNQIGWMLPYFTDVWQYTVTHYGQFTDGTRDGRVYMIIHQNKYSGGHPSTYFDGSHDYRNVSDTGPGGWPDGSYDIPTHEIAHIVEIASRGVHGSPAFGLWGDSKWAEFYLFDVFTALGKTEAADRVFASFSEGTDDFPQPGTHWFRDWFHPLWQDHGGVQVMANYFKLLSEHFPKNGNDYARGLSFGEYVHFMSGAAGTNLKELATTAFGWPKERENEFVAAQSDFPGVTY